jgi:hypothetical protein
MFHSWPFNQDLWTLYHKVTFDGDNKLIIVNLNENLIEIKKDIYSDWKEWAMQRDYLKFLPALRAIGGDPTIGGKSLGSTFFTINGWQILIQGGTNFVGNIFSDDFSTPFLAANGVVLATSEVSNLVDTVKLNSSDLISAGVASSGQIDNQTIVLSDQIDNQTTILRNDITSVSGTLPFAVVNQLNSTTYDGVPFVDIMNILLSMAQGRIVESASGVFEFYAQDNATSLYTLTKTGNQRLRS